MMSKLVRFFGIAALGAPLVAIAAGGPTTAHVLSFTVKSASQTTSSAHEKRLDKASGNSTDIFQACVGRSPSKTEGVYLFLDCANLDHNVIAAIDTNPLFDTTVAVGSVDFDLPNVIVSTKGGVVKSATVPVVVKLDCNAGALTATLFGIMDLNFSALGTSPACPNSGSVKIVGTGTSSLTGQIPPTFVIDNGSSMSVKKRSGAIASFPPFLP